MDFIFEFQKATSRFELETESLFMALEMCDMRHDDMIRRANYKIFCESGTYEDALYLYEEANAETSEQKEGIITRIVNWISEQLRKLKNFLLKSVIDEIIYFKEKNKRTAKFEIDIKLKI